ncbi:hypothetical protein chiPu_0015063 [Chiloscyllium punctatum]|uniref:Uncharacterized protein n=1 Tax=Chiloscyllium punctatum TaxID=137246 RepID=A0A401T1S4_CHIPU|nr:hypothetical protein [Chiloscyllium punctatum]
MHACRTRSRGALLRSKTRSRDALFHALEACREVTWSSVSRAKQGHVELCFTRKTKLRGVEHPGTQGGGEWSQINNQSEDNPTSVIA